MGEDDLFEIFPDMDLDGDHDIVDFLILDEINNEIQRELDECNAVRSSFSMGDGDIDEYSEIDPDNYETEEE